MPDSQQLFSPQPVTVGTLTAASASQTTPSGDGSTVVVANNKGDSCAAFQLVASAFSGTVQFEGSVDGANFYPIKTIGVADLPIRSPGVVLSGAINLIYQVNISGFAACLARCTTFTSGSLAVTAQTSQSGPDGAETDTLSALVATNNPNATSVASYELLDNGTTHDQAISAQSSTVLASASRTVTTAGPDTIAKNARRLTLLVNVTIIGTGSISPALQVKDSISGLYFTVWTAAVALTANGLYGYHFSPGGSGGSWTELVANFGPPGRTFRWQLVSNNANAVTASVSQELLP